MAKKIIVTGANRGIGKEICRQLVEKGNEVYLTARSAERGREAAREVGCTFMQLDVSSADSIQAFSEAFRKNVGSLDVLVNNAAIMYQEGKSFLTEDMDHVRQTIEVNTLGPWQMIQAFAELLQQSPDGRIINVSSEMGQTHRQRSNDPAYRISKTALNGVTLMAHAQLGDQIAINAMCPGWVQTDMGGKNAARTVSKGAETAVWLATANDTPRGKFVKDMQVEDW